MTVAKPLGADSLALDPRAHNLLVGADVEIDPTAAIGANVILGDGVRIGAQARIKNNCVIGERPTLAIDSTTRAQGPQPTLIAAGATICNGVVIFAGASIGEETIIGDQALVREGATIEEDVVIGRGCVVGVDATVGARTKVQSNSGVLPSMLIEADVVIGGNVTGVTDMSFGRDSALARTPVILRRGCRIGSAVCFLPGIEVGEEAVVGAGAVVRESVAPRTKVAGVPARVLGVVGDG
ncbi:MAG: DapH/DapD/GlmU-related protein [Solirubrobacterales bacterium]